MTDPKHLPPRDCLVLIDDTSGPTWVHCECEVMADDDHAWHSKLTGETIDPSRVITWTELPEVDAMDDAGRLAQLVALVNAHSEAQAIHGAYSAEARDAWAAQKKFIADLEKP